MIKRQFQPVNIGGIKNIKIVFEEDNLDLLTTLFFTDGSTICQPALAIIKEIKMGKRTSWEMSGNTCEIEINKDTTTVMNIFDDSICCTVSTDDFNRLVSDWIDELDRI